MDVPVRLYLPGLPVLLFLVAAASISVRKTLAGDSDGLGPVGISLFSLLPLILLILLSWKVGGEE
jgi:hypothetical protein